LANINSLIRVSLEQETCV